MTHERISILYPAHIVSGTAPPPYNSALQPVPCGGPAYITSSAVPPEIPYNPVLQSVPSGGPAQITSSAIPPELPNKPALGSVPVQYSVPDQCHSVSTDILSISLVSLLFLMQTITNVQIVQDQPKPTVYTIQTTNSKSSFGTAALWAAFLLTIFTLILGCWFASIFSTIGLSLAAAVSALIVKDILVYYVSHVIFHDMVILFCPGIFNCIIWSCEDCQLSQWLVSGLQCCLHTQYYCCSHPHHHHFSCLNSYFHALHIPILHN